MPREIQVLRFCDRHHDRAAVGDDVIAALNGDAARRVDVCEECRESIVAPFEELLALGVLPDQQKQTDDGFTCPICSHVLKNRPSLSHHLRQQHQTGLRELAKRGVTV